MKANTEADFWMLVAKRGPDECWGWYGRSQRGYGRFRFGGLTQRTHRLAWAFAHGPVPEGMCVCHHCDNPRCCNPKHLFIGTSADNNADKVAKGRQSRGKDCDPWKHRR